MSSLFWSFSSRLEQRAKRDHSSTHAGAHRHGPHQDHTAHVHSRASLASRDVRRFLCSHRHLSRVLNQLIRLSYDHQTLNKSFSLSLSLNRIVEKKNAHDRMIQVMKWYLSTLHAGRKSPVAKKPYNPILGEIFQCWYSVPQLEQSGSSDRTLVSDGPVTWSTRDQLSFIAEQVSHHPPSNSHLSSLFLPFFSEYLSSIL